ncbi:MAG: hypothetical protein AAFX93_09575 [Verrucomicrobiota bacterium]
MKPLALFFSLLIAIALPNLTAGQDLAGNAALGEDPLPGKYTAEQVNSFLEQFVGTWEGKYAIGSLDGVTLMEFEAQMTYEWDVVGETQVLRNSAVYSNGQTMNHATALSYFWLGRIVSEVEENEVKRVYLGDISEDEKSVNWRPANTETPTRTSFRETFVPAEGGTELKIQGHEDYQKGMRRRLLILSGLLKKVDE